MRPATATQTVTIDRAPGQRRAECRCINPPACAKLVCNISGVGSADPNTGDTFTYLWNFGDGTPTQHLIGSGPHVPGCRYLHRDPDGDRWLGEGEEHNPERNCHGWLSGPTAR